MLSQIVAVSILDIKAHIILNVFIFSIIRLNISRIVYSLFVSTSNVSKKEACYEQASLLKK